jgi:hypothetical protein
LLRYCRLSSAVGWDEATPNPSYTIPMRTYTRLRLTGGWYFFTVTLAARRSTDLHYNPLKHGYAHAVSPWPYSSLHRWGYPMDWAASPEVAE